MNTTETNRPRPRPARITETSSQKSPSGIAVTEWRPLRKGDSLQGFLTLVLPSGMVLHDCTYHERSDGARWIGLPARQYEKDDGSKSWVRLIDFRDRPIRDRFQRDALAALDEYFAMIKAARKVV